MKKILIGVMVVFVIGGVFLILHSLSGSSTSSGAPSVGLPISGTVPQNQTSSPPIQIITENGSTIMTANFLKDPQTVSDPINPGDYFLGYHPYEGVADPTATATPPYVITYIAATHYFNIVLLQEPISTVRIEAEQYLLAHLAISVQQLCALNYMVTVPSSVNNFYAGENLGFASCSNAVTLPQ